MGYVGSPYNFVPFYDKVVKVDKKDMDVRGVLKDELLTGEISYTLKAETPLFIDDGKKDPENSQNYINDFFKNEEGKYAIPGSTMRGLIRNNCQILGLSSFDDDIDDYMLMYRNVASGAEKGRYTDVLGAVQDNKKKISVLKNVKAGYIAKETKNNGKEVYVIYKTEVEKIKSNGEMNYYILSERDVAYDYNHGKKSYPFLYQHPEYMQHDITKGFKKQKDKNNRDHYKGTQNPDYKPGYYDVNYEIVDLKKIDKVYAPGTGGPNVKQGVLVCTGKMNEKKVLYVIPKRIEETIEIPEEDVISFRIDFEKKKNGLKQYKNVDFFNLPEDDEIKPVFYIQLDRLYFGFTPRLRLFYDNTIKSGLHQNPVDFDLTKSIFGMTSEKDSYKSKVSFSDAVIDDYIGCCERKNITLESPKPTSYLDYIEQGDGEVVKTYNDDDFRLRGVKQYWLHNKLVSTEGKVAENDKTSLKPLNIGTEFNGKIRFNNLTRTELGLLTWAVRLNDNSWMNIGKAKSYGYGAVSIRDIKVNIVNYSDAYSYDGLSLNPFAEVDVNNLIDTYKEEISKEISPLKIDDLPHIKDFFIMKDSKQIPLNEDTKYMSIDDKDYQDRVIKNSILANPSQVINNEDGGKAKKKEKNSSENKGTGFYTNRYNSNGAFGNKNKGNPVHVNNTEKTKETLRPAQKVKPGINTAECTEYYQNKKVKFQIGGSYPKFKPEEIKFNEEITRENFKELIPIGSKWEVDYHDDGNTKFIELLKRLDE
ncbi:MAG: TIGR03986 family CRISPR-associated RAMP protein [Lachnospiraceae bacterium]|nr:TIGR03986 family CRISPR-associated RAMP protein [Lachnospiraceae bacterium]